MVKSDEDTPEPLMTDDLAFTSAAELAALIARRAVSPVELVDAVLDRIERSQPALNAFITVRADEARAAAREAEAAVVRGETLGPLHGVPFAVKDLVNTAGVRTTFGSVALAGNWRPTRRRWRASKSPA
jgi:aspartyl-tRNA(Asn)/glutamyl-tRNA(Gln) amidotransferase subunit A